MLNESFNRQAARWLALAGMSALATAVQAADPASTANGVMTFPNVEVVTAPAAAPADKSARATESQSGFKAFKDPVTGELVHPTAEQAAALEAAGKAKPLTQRGVAAAKPEAKKIYPAQGGVGMALDDSHASYFVAGRTTGGELVTACEPGEKTALSALKAKSTRHTHTDVKGAVK